MNPEYENKCKYKFTFYNLRFRRSSIGEKESYLEDDELDRSFTEVLRTDWPHKGNQVNYYKRMTDRTCI